MKLEYVRGRAVGQGAVGLVPDIFRWTEFRDVGRERFHMQSGMASDPLRDFAAAMDDAPIPEQDHRPPKMPEQVCKKGPDLQPREIVGAKMEIEGQSSPCGRHGQGADRRDAIVCVVIANDRRRAFGGPDAGHVGDEQETGFIEEDQMGATTLSVF